MAEAYILINCEIGSEEDVITALKSIDGIKEVHGTFGAYDILAKEFSSCSSSFPPPKRMIFKGFSFKADKT